MRRRAGKETVIRGNVSDQIVLRHARIVDVLHHRVVRDDVLLEGGWIRQIGSIGTALDAVEVEAGGRFLLPGMMDGHVHIESAMLYPAEFARAAALHGTTAVFADPHEIANVLGVHGIEYMLQATERLPLDFCFGASSCVPATQMETAGGEVTAEDVRQLLKHPRVFGLAEVMNFPGVIAGNPEILRKIALTKAHEKVVDGHCPGLRGEGLRKYVDAGVESDHETTSLDEAREKLALGMWLMIREGSAAKNLQDLLPAVTDETLDHCLFVSDDQTPADLTSVGHMDHVLRKAVSLGLDPVRAVRMATWNTAQRFRMPDIGVVREGAVANLILVEDMESFHVTDVFHRGAPVVRNGALVTDFPCHEDPSVLHTVTLPPLDEGAFRIPTTSSRARVIGLTPAQLLTTCLEMEVKIENGGVVSDTSRDILKLVVVERHGKNGNIGLGLVHGLGLKRGALAQSVAHDSHNVIVAGTNDADMLAAARTVAEMGGGCVVVDDQIPIARLPLGIAGLMSTAPISQVLTDYGSLHAAARDLGAVPEHPFASLSFLALPVIPELKLTDMGLVQFDSAKQAFTFVPVCL
ncbi:MAG: adenine deaminase [Armatimonadetes bacterium CG2_30_59_28]|nr:MAG: adenine deaminase [Armatimonadetes bacterium CG2_30_59_28]